MRQNYVELKAVERIQGLPYETYHTYELSHEDTPWMKELLEEVCDYDRDDQEYISEPLYLRATIDIKRDINPRLKEYLLIKAHVKCGYYTPCTRCLLPSYEQVEFDFDLCFLNKIFEKDKEYEDEDSVLVENQEFELYFYEKQNIQFKESFREQLLMQLPPYSLHSEECKGLCPVCGANKNVTECSHK